MNMKSKAKANWGFEKDFVELAKNGVFGRFTLLDERKIGSSCTTEGTGFLLDWSPVP